MADNLPEQLRFIPWWRHGDPPPEPWILELLDKVALQELAVSRLQYQKAVLEAQAKHIDQQVQILSRKR